MVDDAILIIKRLAEMVSEVSCISTVIVANTYAEAVKLINDETPDIVLLDIHLPDKSGIELLEYIKQDFNHIKVIMVSNKVAQYYKDLCFTKGANHFIDKSKEFENIPSILEYYSEH